MKPPSHISITVDCGLGCPPIHLNLPVESVSHGNQICLHPTERGGYLIRQAFIAHHQGVHP